MGIRLPGSQINIAATSVGYYIGACRVLLNTLWSTRKKRSVRSSNQRCLGAKTGWALCSSDLRRRVELVRYITFCKLRSLEAQVLLKDAQSSRSRDMTQLSGRTLTPSVPGLFIFVDNGVRGRCAARLQERDPKDSWWFKHQH